MPRGPFATKAGTGRAGMLSAETLVNLYPEPAEQGAITKLVLFGSPGLSTFTSGLGAPVRGVHAALGYVYAVAGTTLYRVNATTGAATACTGDGISGDGPCMMADDGLTMVIVADGWAWSVQGTVAARFTDTDFPGATSVAYLDGYMLFSVPNSGQYLISALYAPTNIDALDFATAEGAPDNLVRVIVDHREGWLFGAKSTEIVTNTGNAEFPLERVGGAMIERGCLAPLSVAKMDNSVFWLGDDRIVYRANGYTPARVSTTAIEEVLRGTVDDAEAWTYALGGHHCYVITLPSQGRTFVYDAMTALWHERRSGTLDSGRWRGACGTTADGRVIVGDALGGNLGLLDVDTYTEFGAAIRRVARSAPLYAAGNGARMHALELEAQLGVGLGSGQGSDPSAMLRTSDDGGATWSPERTRSFGAQGNRRARVQWRQLGRFRQPRTVEVAISDPVKVAIFGWRHETQADAA